MTYGCYNRAPFKPATPVQSGWQPRQATREPTMAWVPFRMATDCQYTLSDLGQADQKCNGCKWRKTVPADPAINQGKP